MNNEVINETETLQYYSTCPKRELINALYKAVPIYRRISEYEENASATAQKTDTHFRVFKWMVISPALAVSYLISIILSLPFPNNVGTDLLFFLVLPILFTILIMNFINKKRDQRISQKTGKITQEENDFIQNNICPELFCIPRNFQYYTAANYILSCLEDMRADTLKEAVNLYVEQYDRWQQLNQMAELQRTANEIRDTQNFIADAIAMGLVFK